MHQNSCHQYTPSLKSFKVLQKLEEGTFANVYKVQKNYDNKFYAMKKVKISQAKDNQRDYVLNEVKVLASISHPNIINYSEAFFDDPTECLCLVMQYADSGDIQKKINEHSKNQTFFTESQIWQALIQISKGLKTLHENNFLHRDLKCSNILYTKDNKYKIGNLIRSTTTKKGMARTLKGAQYYTCPEVWKDKPYDTKCDIWSMGCILYEMASLSPPFKANNLKQLYAKVQKGIFNRIPSFYSEDLTEMINNCLKVNPASRPSASEILNHPKVTKNIPILQRYASENYLRKEENLVTTTLCHKNLRPLRKVRTKGSPNKSNESKSVNSLKRQSLMKKVIPTKNNCEISRLISSPISKQNRQSGRKINSALQRRHSQQKIILVDNKKKQQICSSKEKQFRRKVAENNSKHIRNNSLDSLRKRNQSNKSKQNHQKKEQKNKSHSFDTNNPFFENISNKCRNIKERAQFIIANQNTQKHQQIPNHSEVEKKQVKINSKEKRQRKMSDCKSGNNQKGYKPKVNSPDKRKISQKKNSQKSLKKNKSHKSLERANSKKHFQANPAQYFRK